MNAAALKLLLFTQLTLNVWLEFTSESTCTGPPPAADNTLILLIIKPIERASKTALPIVQQTPVIAQSDATVYFNETSACTQHRFVFEHYFLMMLNNLN